MSEAKAGKYDDLAAYVYAAAKAEAVVVMVINGEKGAGFSVVAPGPVLLELPTHLRFVASGIEEQRRAPEMDNEPANLVIVCGDPGSLERLSEKARARIDALDGPFEVVCCQGCSKPCMMGRTSRNLLAAGTATSWRCMDCMIDAVQAFTQGDTP